MTREESRRLASLVSDREPTSNTQRILVHMVNHISDGWIPGPTLDRVVPNAASRLRDLRKAQFGGFVVERANAREVLGSKASVSVYRLAPTSVTRTRVSKAFSR